MDFKDWQHMNPSGYDHHDPDSFNTEDFFDELEEIVDFKRDFHISD